MLGHDDILERVRRLERESEARSLVAEYCYAVDAQDPDRLTALFHDEITIQLGERHAGLESCLAIYERYWRGLDHSRHLVGTVQVHARGTGVDVSSYFTVADVLGSDLRIVWGTYEDTYSAATHSGRLQLTEKRICVERVVRVRDRF